MKFQIRNIYTNELVEVCCAVVDAEGRYGVLEDDRDYGRYINWEYDGDWYYKVEILE